MKLTLRSSLALATATVAAVGIQSLALASQTGTAGTLTYTHTVQPAAAPVACPSGATVFSLAATSSGSALRAAAPVTTAAQLHPASTLNYAAKVVPAHTIQSMTNNVALVGFDAGNKAIYCGQGAGFNANTILGQDAANQLVFTSMPAGAAKWQATVNGVVANTDGTFYRFNETVDAE